MANSVVSELILRLKDDVSGKAKQVAAALAGVTAAEKKIGQQSSEMNKLTQALERAQAAAKKLGEFRDAQRGFAAARATFVDAKKRVEDLGRAMAAAEKPTRQMTASYRAAQNAVKAASAEFDKQKTAVLAAKSALAGFDVSISKIASAEARLKGSIDQTTAAIKRQAEAEATALRKREASIARRNILGNAAATAGVVAGYKARDIGAKAVVSAAEFDIGVRKQRAYTGISGEQQGPLIAQAKKIGQDTQFTNLDIVHAQTAVMQGLPETVDRARVALGITEEAKNYALAMGADMKTSAEAIRSYLASTGKDISTEAAATKNARKATNMMIRMAKLGGMSDEDVQQFMKFGAASSTIAGMSDETRGAIAIGLRRAGVRGDEAGVFLRSASSKLVAPTNEGMAALASAGIDYNKFTKMPGGLSVGSLETKFKQDFGKGFTPAIREKLQEILTDDEMIGDRGAFTSAVTDAVASLFDAKKDGKMKAADRNKVAKKVGAFHKLSTESVDVEGLLAEILKSDPSLALLNAFFTDKHGGKGGILAKVFSQFGKDREALGSTPDDFGSKIAEEIMGGLGGSFERLKGSIENFNLAVGTANEGLLKFGMDHIGNAIDGISNLGDGALRVATILGGLAAAGGFVAGAWKLLGTFSSGFGLTASAAALTESAVALNVAAARLSLAAGAEGIAAGGVAAGGAAAGGAVAGAGRASILARLGRFGVFGLGLLGMYGGMKLAEAGGYGKSERAVDNSLDALAKKGIRWSPALQESMADHFSPGGMQQLGRMTDRGFHGNPSPFPTLQGGPEAGAAAGAQAGQAVAQGIQEQAPAIVEAAKTIMQALQNVFASGITVPIKPQVSGSASLPGVHADTGIGSFGGSGYGGM